jgi:demethylmenaquinone methyltransferase/2-methoxy-6-polyprenyl-1,4-benzoquinol methylase
MSSSPSKQPDKIREMFGSIAGRYDLLNRVLSLSVDRYWRREMVECLEEGPVLDVACGTGDVMRALGKKGIRPVYGLDFSLPMILEGTNKMDGDGSFVQSDAAMIPVSDSTFRGITCAFGVRNFQDRSKCFQEFRRVMTPGGRLVILEFFPPEDRWYLKPYHFYLRNVLPKIGQWISGSEKAYGYLQSSVESFASRRTVQKELREAGFEQVEHRDLTMGIATLIVADCS